MHKFFIASAVVLAAAMFGQRTSAQTLTSSLFERYLESLREPAGIPGMSALVLQDGVVAPARACQVAVDGRRQRGEIGRASCRERVYLCV